MARVSESDGLIVNIMERICWRYAVVVLPIIAVLVWCVPYQEVTYKAVSNEQSWVYLFPNVRGVLKVPFADPQKVSGALVFLDALLMGWFVFAFIFGSRYVRALKEWRVWLASRCDRKESIKLMLYGVIVILAGGGSVFGNSGAHNWMWGGFLYENELVFVLFNLVSAWFVTWSYFLILALFLKDSQG